MPGHPLKPQCLQDDPLMNAYRRLRKTQQAEEEAAMAKAAEKQAAAPGAEADTSSIPDFSHLPAPWAQNCTDLWQEGAAKVRKPDGTHDNWDVVDWLLTRKGGIGARWAELEESDRAIEAMRKETIDLNRIREEVEQEEEERVRREKRRLANKMRFRPRGEWAKAAASKTNGSGSGSGNGNGEGSSNEAQAGAGEGGEDHGKSQLKVADEAAGPANGRDEHESNSQDEHESDGHDEHEVDEHEANGHEERE